MGAAPTASSISRDSGNDGAYEYAVIGADLYTQTESLFHSYSQYASLTQPPPTPSEDEQRLKNQIEELLGKVFLPDLKASKL